MLKKEREIFGSCNVWSYVYFAIKSIGLGGVDYFCLGRSKQNCVYHFFQIRYARRYLVRVSIYVELNKYQKIFSLEILIRMF